MAPPTKAPPKKLINWVPRIVDNSSNLQVLVEGLLIGSESKGFWRTTAITKAVKPRELETCSGTVYVLRGSLFVEQCVALRYPQALIDAFYSGFPSRWFALLNELHKLITGQIDLFGAELPFCVNNDFKTPTPARTRNQNKSLVSYTSTPTTVATTRYGRTIKPRLANWAGQRITYDVRGNVVDATHAGSSRNVDSQTFTNVCNTMGVAIAGRPPPLAIEPSPVTRRKPKETPATQRRKKVYHGISSDEEMSIDNEPLPEATPIVMSRVAQKRRKELLQVLESSEGEDEEDEVVESRPKRRKNAKTEKPAAKRGRKAAVPPPTRGLIRFPKTNLNETQSTIHTTRSRTTRGRQPIVEYPDSEVTADVSIAMTSVSTVTAPTVRKRWTATEKTSLIKALNAKNPVSDADWESITRAFGPRARATSEYIDMARQLGWKYLDSDACRRDIAVGGSSVEPSNPMNLSTIDENDAPESANVSFNVGISAKPGTGAYLIQADRLNRQMMATKPLPSNVTAILNESRNCVHTSADTSALDLDDSVFDIAVDQAEVQKHTKRPNFFHGVYMPGPSTARNSFSLNDTIGSQPSESDPSIMQGGASMLTANDPKTRERRIRYVHGALGHQQRSMRYGMSMTNQSTFMVPPVNSFFVQPSLTRQQVRRKQQRGLLEEELEEAPPEFSDDEENEESEGL